MTLAVCNYEVRLTTKRRHVTSTHPIRPNLVRLFETPKVVAEESSHPFREPLLASTESCPATGRDWRSCLCSLVTREDKKERGSNSRFGWTRFKQKERGRQSGYVRTANEEGHGASRRPGAASVAAIFAFQYFKAHVLVSSSFCSLCAALLRAYFLWQLHTVHFVPVCE